jgi:hypothetical protein
MALPTFPVYCRKVWNSLPATAKHWARDQIVWPAVLTGLITIVPAVYLHKKIDWELFQMALLLYLIVFCTYGLFQFIRASWRTYQTQDSEIQGLRKTVETRVHDWTEAKKEAMREAEKHLLTNRQLVTTLEQLVAAQKEASNNSQAFHAEYAKNSELRGELERFKSNRVKEEWKKLEEDFFTVTGPPNVDMQALWEKKMATGETSWSLMRGWDEDSRQRFWIVMNEAGQLLLSSDYAQSKYPELLKENDHEVRWLNVLCAELEEPMTISGHGYTRETGNTESGVIEDLPRKCIRCCAIFASREQWPAPKAPEA